jgi:hypothetical protein
MCEVIGGVEPCNFKSDCGLNRVLAVLNEVCLPQPSFQGAAVGHREGAVAVLQMASKQINPGCDDCR